MINPYVIESTYTRVKIPDDTRGDGSQDTGPRIAPGDLLYGRKSEHLSSLRIAGGYETDHSLCSLEQNPKTVSGCYSSALRDRFFCGVKIR